MPSHHYTLLGSDSKPTAESLVRRLSRRQWLLLGLGGLFVVTFLFHSVNVSSSSTAQKGGVVEVEGQVVSEAVRNELQPWMNIASSLNYDHPTTLARDNLRNDSYYLTAFPAAGFTNKVIAYMHLIHLAVVSNRIPIIPPVIPPGWVSVKAGLIPFGEIFNLTTLRSALRRPVLEWYDVKIFDPKADVEVDFSPTDPTLEHFGCWSAQARTKPTAKFVKGAENVLRIDLSFTRVPDFAYFNHSDKGDFHTTFPALSTLVYPKYPHPAARKGTLLQASRMNSTLSPGEHLACFDFLYFVSGGVKTYEFENRWSPAWNNVGTHMKFTDALKDLTGEYLRRAMKLSTGEPIPKMITLHIRRNDFKFRCRNGQTPPCFMPLYRYKNALADIQRELLETRGLDVRRVFVASDEVDESFWQEISSLGWSYFNHTAERTFERYGEWYPLLIDKVALSMGVGFVGTRPSTFSILNAFRVEDWNNGVTRMLDYYSD